MTSCTRLSEFSELSAPLGGLLLPPLLLSLPLGPTTFGAIILSVLLNGVTEEDEEEDEDDEEEDGEEEDSEELGDDTA